MPPVPGPPSLEDSELCGALSLELVSVGGSRDGGEMEGCDEAVDGGGGDVPIEGGGSGLGGEFGGGGD